MRLTYGDVPPDATFDRFLDIPQYIRDSGYKVHSDLKYLPVQLHRWYNERVEQDLDDNRYTDFRLPVPDFQRGHVWTDDQQSAFVEHLLRGGDGGPIRFNHPGWMKNWEGQMEIVDGLQRVTACLRFVDNEVKAFGNYRRDYRDRMRIVSCRLELHVNSLPTRAQVLRWYLQLNAGGTPHTQNEIGKVRDMLAREGE